MKEEILATLSKFDRDAPEWCLPRRFWERAELITGYSAFPMNRCVDLPHRQCHFSSIRMYRAGQQVPECSLEIVTGYAFTIRKWFRHTWVINPPDKILLECTPSKFERYYGVRLSTLEAKQFADIIGYEAEISPVYMLHRGEITFNTLKNKNI